VAELTLRKREDRSMAYRFEIYKDKAGEYRVRFKAPNGETMFATEGYTSKTSALSAIASIQSNGPSALIDDRSK
jgi:uncharacterized protein YegP (UPF0339 family)